MSGVSSNQTATQLERPAGAAKRPCVAFVPGSHAVHTEDLGGLLRYRLRLAGTISLVALTLIFFKALFFPTIDTVRSVDHIAMGSTVIVLSLFVGLLWSRQKLHMTGLRLLEAGVFGAMAFFFLYVQFAIFTPALYVGWARPEYREELLQFGTISNIMRWFILIVIYGVFIPNTWKRVALVVGILSLLPIAATFAFCGLCPIVGHHVPTMLFDMVLLLGMASAIAIFGSYRIGQLRTEAQEARKLGQYTLSRKLGAGGMGEVYLGEHVLLRRQCAIKLIRSEQAGDCLILNRFEREVQAMAKLTHWNTVEIYDYGRAEDGTFYYVMEYLPGLSLQDLVEWHGPVPAARAVHFLRQVCGALREAHGIGLIHRDIKPSNVIATTRGGVQDVAKLLDFGLVVSFGAPDEKLTMQGAVLGSPAYMSPEQARAKGPVDARTDIYSLGATAHFLLTGQPVFERDSAMEMLVAHIHEKPPSIREQRPEVPAELEAIIFRCLEKDPIERYQSIDDLDAALADCPLPETWDLERAARWWKNREAEETRRAEAPTSNGELRGVSPPVQYAAAVREVPAG